MKSKDDYKESITFIDEAISNIKLEQQRIEVLQQDSDKIADIIK